MLAVGALYVLAVCFGLSLGSFINVLAVRWREGVSLWGRSRCLSCKQPIRAQHLLPVVSWIWLRGACADCSVRISPSYVWVELAMGALTMIAFVRHPEWMQGSWFGFLFEVAFGFVVLSVSVFDLRWQLLPVNFLAWAGGVFGLWNVLAGWVDAWSVLTGVVVGAVLLGVPGWLSRGRWMGAGDAWMAAMLGAALGIPRLWLALYASAMVGGLVAAVLLLTGRATRETRISLAPILGIGGFMALWGSPWAFAFLRDLLA